ncbi:MAG TPA: hypothetical protein VKH37_12815, partial [Ferruginibacter sp.]|nr:hypothetical protein [Ferruginibacter sp.]
MVRITFITASFVFISSIVSAQQQTREELEKQRAQLKNEIEQTGKMLKDVNTKTKASYNDFKLISNKVNLQERVIDNINRDIDILDNNIA